MMKMKKILLILMLGFGGTFVQAENVTCSADPLNFNEGDTLTAAFLQEIIERIDKTLIGITNDELIGTWQCTTTLADRGEGTSNGYALETDTLNYTMTQTVTVAADGDYHLKATFPNNMGYASSDSEDQTCRWAMVGGGRLRTIKHPDEVDGVEGIVCNNLGSRPITKLTNQCFTMQATNDATVSCKSATPLPLSPKNLSVSVDVDTGIASLAWTTGDSTQTEYIVKRKDTLINDKPSSGASAYITLATVTEPSYSDSSIAKGRYSWYRVYAKNANGTSSGSNVIKVSYINNPPSINLSSTIAVNEGILAVVTIGASDADGDSLTYTLANRFAGTDAEDLSVSSEGVITFNASPDWEIPTDYNTDNIYDIRVSVSDGIDTVSQDVSVVVLDVDGS